MKKFLFTILFVSFATFVSAQENELSLPEENSKAIEKISETLNSINNLKISGYIQAQWQLTEFKGGNAGFAGGDFPEKSNNRFMIRRGRVKFDYTYGVAKAVLQIDATEKGVKVKDAYVAATSKNGIIGGTAGIFDRPFGYEISYSSSRRESPERSRVFQTLFPDERDLGAKITLKGKKGSALGAFRFDGGYFSGNGANSETDSKKDFIGHLAYIKTYDNISFGIGTSLYSGGVLNLQNEQYNFNKKDGKYIERTGVADKYSKREYYGFDAQFSAMSSLGFTSVRAEYLWGSQPGTVNSSNSPKAAITSPLYNRKFSGYYVYLIQGFGKTNFSGLFKYDKYDPNRQISNNQIGAPNSGTGIGDISYSTYGFGLLWSINKSLRLMAYYELITNETSKYLTSDNRFKNFSEQINDNVLTIRAQVKF